MGSLLAAANPTLTIFPMICQSEVILKSRKSGLCQRFPISWIENLMPVMPVELRCKVFLWYARIYWPGTKQKKY